jgi:molybdopterin converting factor small subunit
MRIRVKLMGALRSRLPPENRGVGEVELPAAGNVAALLEHLGIAAGHVHLVMVNGEQAANRQRPLADGDEVTVFPPVAGG